MKLYDDPFDMEPLFPNDDNGKLKVLANELIFKAGMLSSKLHPRTREAVASIIKPMNSYYSNLIEGHFTHPIDIERAMKMDYSSDLKKRNLQLESVAHINVQEKLEQKLEVEATASVCSPEFIRWIHKEFYLELPDEFRFVEGLNTIVDEVIPGEFRTVEIQVGRHIGPAHQSLDRFCQRFFQGYNPESISDPVRRIIAAAASHHRLAWIHPFRDGNGRVMRLYTHAYLSKLGLHGHGLWSITRGFARNQSGYRAALNNADLQRYNDYDGRGNLSDKGLFDFCTFFLETAIDQVDFMTELLDLESIQKRINYFIDLHILRNQFREEHKYILAEVFVKGKIMRKEVERITGKSENTARKILKELIDVGLLVSDDPNGAVRIHFPIRYVAYFLPKLYPGNIEATLDPQD